MTTHKQLTDEQLFLGYRNSNDETLFEMLVERYRDPLQGYLMRQLNDRNLAEDALQQVFLKMFRKRDQFQAGRRFKPWIYRIASNQSIDSRRREARHFHLPLDHQDSAGEQNAAPADFIASDLRGPDEIAERREQQDRSREAIDQLSPRLQKTVQLIYRDQLKYREAADELSVPLGTIKSRVNCALRQLRLILSPQAAGAV